VQPHFFLHHGQRLHCVKLIVRLFCIIQAAHPHCQGRITTISHIFRLSQQFTAPFGG
jgi:hypothetical protein